jgi:hypothetical protein
MGEDDDGIPITPTPIEDEDVPGRRSPMRLGLDQLQEHV